METDNEGFLAPGIDGDGGWQEDFYIDLLAALAKMATSCRKAGAPEPPVPEW